MSIPQLAQQLAAQGRGTDDQLVHMSAKEINGLQALAQKHGGSLSVNPTTGLVEAGFLDNILPVVAGAGLMAMGVPDPWMAAALVGGGDALVTGSLQKGLMAGLGAYGGAGLGQGLMSLGADSAATAAGSAATPTAGISAAPTEATIPGMSASEASVNGLGTAPQAQYADVNGLDPSAYKATPLPQAQPMGVTFQNNLSSMGTGITNLGNPGGVSAYTDAMGGTKDALKYAGAAAAPTLMSSVGGAGPVAQGGPSALQNTVRPWSYSRTPNAQYGSSGTPYFNETWTQGTPYVAAAGGGLLRGGAKGESLRGSLGALHGVERLTHYAAGGGISNLGSYSDGGQLLRGPGSGVSDDIPATIGGAQPARLADGEFVVPARIVSELGNGSTDAGAKQLYAMLDRVQKARKRTMGGNSAYAKDTKAHTMLPA